MAESLLGVHELAVDFDLEVARGSRVLERDDVDLVGKPSLDEGLGSSVPRPVTSPATPLDRDFD